MKTISLVACVIAGMCASSMNAAVITVRPTVVGVLAPDFSPIDPTAIVSIDRNQGAVLRPSAEYYILQIDVLMTITDLQPGQLGFGNAAFNINLFPQLTQSVDLPGWYPNTATTDKNGPSPGGIVPQWADNGDYGPSGSDLQGIIIGTAPRDFGPVGVDPRRTLGIGRPGTPFDGEYAASLYLELPGDISDGSLEIDVIGGSTYDAQGDLSTVGVTGVGGRLDFQVVPEPAAFTILVIGCVGLFAIRRRV